MKTLATLALLSLATAAHARPAIVTDDRLHELDHARFVLTAEDAPANVKLHPLKRMSYDSTSIADATDLDAPHTFTVLAAKRGSCRADVTKRVFVRPMIGPHATKVALDLDGACTTGALLVIDGTTDATADAITAPQREAIAAEVRWFERTTGKTALVSYTKQAEVWVQELAHGVTLVSGEYAGGNELVVRRGGRVIERVAQGAAIAILHDHGDRIVVKTPDGLRTVTLAAS